MKKIEKNLYFYFPKWKNDGKIVRREKNTVKPKGFARFYKGGTILNASDITIIVIVLLAIGIFVAYRMNRKAMGQMIQAQDFIDANRQTVQIFVIDKKNEKPSTSNMPKAVFEQLPKKAKAKKAFLVRAKVGPQIVTLMCDKPVYEVMPVKKNVKVDLAGMYIVSITGMNLEDKKKKTFSEKIAASATRTMQKESKKAKEKANK